MSRSRLFATTLLSVTLLAGTVAAQVAPRVNPNALPGSIEPGRLQDRFQIQERPPVSGEPLVQTPQSNEGAGPALDATSTFTLRQVNITGNTVLPASKFQHHYAHLVGQYVNLGTLQQIAQRITADYRKEGYVLSRAIVPAQRIDNGTATIQIVEGYVNRVTFKGDYPNERMLQAYAGPIKASRPLNVADLERGLLLMDDLSGMTARGTLTASQGTSGASDLVVTLEHLPIQGGVFVNNRGSRFLGPLQGDALVQSNGVLGLDEQITARTIQALNLEELSYYEGAIEVPVGNLGTVVRANGSYADTEPGNFLEQFDLEGESKTAILRVEHPFLRSRRENLFGTFGLTYRDSRFDSFNTELYNDHVRTVDAGASYDFYDNVLGRNGINQISAAVTQGLDVLNANEGGDLLSRANADTNFTKFTADAQRLQDLGSNFALRVATAGQYSLDPLFASEEFAVGSLPYGSAYDPAEISGEHGIAARAELQYLNLFNNSLLYNSQLYTFYDFGAVWNKDELLGEEKTSSIESTGVGLRAEMLDFLEGELEFSVPLSQNVSAERSKGPRVFFNVGYAFP